MSAQIVITHDTWYHALFNAGVKPALVTAWAPFFTEVVQPGNFTLGMEEIDDFAGQVIHESGGLSRLEENLNYSAERMTVVWPHRFPTVADAAPYAHNPQELANKVYGGRLGNSRPNDGWTYRGSGPIMATGYDNFLALEKVTGLPLSKQPDLLRKAGVEALWVAQKWWEGHVPDSVMGDIKKVTKAVNGGDIGLADRIALTTRVHEVLQASDLYS